MLMKQGKAKPPKIGQPLSTLRNCNVLKSRRLSHGVNPHMLDHNKRPVLRP